jgi:hypothetical protein
VIKKRSFECLERDNAKCEFFDKHWLLNVKCC